MKKLWLNQDMQITWFDHREQSSELHRGFGAFMSFTFCFTAVGVICSNALIFEYGINTGGPAVIVWGWIIGSIMTYSTVLTLAEICSTYPVSGSVFHWSGLLAGRKWGPSMSYICGWFNLLGNAACDTSFAYGFAQMIAATVSLSNGGTYNMDEKQMVAIAIFSLFLWVVKNILKVDSQGWFNNVSAVYQLITLVIIIVAILVAAPDRSSSEFVWFGYYNSTGMPNAGYVCLLGMLTSLYGMSGYESASQMSEETTNASIAAPKGMVKGVIAAIITGFAFMLALLYAMGDNLEATVNGVTDQPVMNIFGLAFGDGMGNMNIGGAVSMSVLLLVNIFLGGFSHMTVTTRICYAMARDKALPGSKYIDKVHPKLKIPIRAIIVVFFLDALLCLLPLGSKTAFSAINSISTIGYQISYAIPILLRVTVGRNTFKKGPWHNGRFSIFLGWFSAITLIFTSLCFIFPSSFDENMKQTAIDFNYTCVVVAGVLFVSGIYWFLPKRCGGARHFFKGPRRPEDIEAEEKAKINQFAKDKPAQNPDEINDMFAIEKKLGGAFNFETNRPLNISENQIAPIQTLLKRSSTASIKSQMSDNREIQLVK